MVKFFWISEGRRIAAVRSYHLSKDLESLPRFENLLRAIATYGCGVRLSAEEDHPPSKHKRELAQIFIQGMALTCQQIERLLYLDPVTGKAPERLIHVCE